MYIWYFVDVLLKLTFIELFVLKKMNSSFELKKKHFSRKHPIKLENREIFLIILLGLLLFVIFGIFQNTVT